MIFLRRRKRAEKRTENFKFALQVDKFKAAPEFAKEPFIISLFLGEHQWEL